MLTEKVAKKPEDWLREKDLEMLLSGHVGASGKYLCELLAEYGKSERRAVAAWVYQDAAKIVLQNLAKPSKAIVELNRLAVDKS